MTYKIIKDHHLYKPILDAFCKQHNVSPALVEISASFTSLDFHAANSQHDSEYNL